MAQRRASSHTIASYRDTFRLLAIRPAAIAQGAVAVVVGDVALELTLS